VEEVAADGDYEARSRQRVVRLRQPLPCMVEGVREMLRTAVENVVRNAVHHTAERTPVEIGLECLDVGRDPRAVITIRDHGAGVPESALGELFTPFHQVTDAAHSPADSTGLGLAITERAFRLHGGAVAAANAAGGGRVVTLQLPMTRRA
jgi:signal transduction histidine kinase